MNHAVVTEYLADYLEGDLALDKRALVDAHLDLCGECAQEVAEMQQTIRLLRALPEPEVPPMIAANVMRRIRAGEADPSFFERVQRALGQVLDPSFVLPAAGLAAAALVVAVVQSGGSILPSFGGRGEPEAAVGVVRPGPVVASPEPTARAEEVAVEPVAEVPERSFGASAVRDLAAAPVPDSAAVDGLEAAREVPASDSTAGFPDDAGQRVAEEPARPVPSEEAWEEPVGRSQALADRGSESARSRVGEFFGDAALAQGFAGSSVGPQGLVPATGATGELGRAVPLSVSRAERSAARRGGLRADSGGEDPRDVWLGRALENPQDFARYIAQHNLAEQELWVERLAERAEARGLLGELIVALRSAGGGEAVWLAEDFEARARALEAGASAPHEGESSGAGR